jgi:hypothetical protein
MLDWTRREFIQTAAASVLLESIPISGSTGFLADDSSANSVRIKKKSYAWEWSSTHDTFRILDARGLTITSGLLQPAVIVQPGTDKTARKCVAGKVDRHAASDSAVTITYVGVNGSQTLSLTWRFEDDAFWLEPITYESSAPENIVALHYFAQGTGESAHPTLDNFYLILPGICESPAVSPIVTADLDLTLTSWLGRGSAPAPGLLQQWGLPAHFFCGFHRNQGAATRSLLNENISDAFCCGLAELPTGDLFLETNRGRHSLIVSYRSDLWRHLHGTGPLNLGAKLLWTIGPNYYEAIRSYYQELIRAGIVQRKSNSARKNSVALSPQFNCWGAEVAIGKDGPRLDEPALRSFYEGLTASGMKAGMFVIDDKWEGKYGKLEHSAQRLPHFEQFRQQVKNDGLHFGLWAAFMRCEDPADLGLNLSHMLRQADGQPVVVHADGAQYYLLDFTQPEVEGALRAQAKKFVERYQPDFVKFDFGYELPPLSVAAPKDMQWAGERMMWKGLDVIVKGMREANPDLVVMYYCLSPLFSDYFDLHSPDDLFMAAREYDFEANRRFLFSSLLGEIGIPTYGSGGYDWDSMPQIWFDSALIGTVGSLNSFAGDEKDEKGNPTLIAKYNGIAQALRSSNVFRIEPIDADYFGVTRGAHTSSWARFENNALVGVALRTVRWNGQSGPASYRDLIHTTAPVVVTSKTDDEITRAASLAVVPYGEGELVIEQPQLADAQVTIVEHNFGGHSNEKQLGPQGSTLRIPLRQLNDAGSPLEWIEVRRRKS